MSDLFGFDVEFRDNITYNLFRCFVLNRKIIFNAGIPN